MTATMTQPKVRQIDPQTWFVESKSVTLLTWTVKAAPFGNLECEGGDDGRRCWPFYHKATCCHCDRVRDWLQEQAVVEAVSASYARYTAETEVTLESLFASPPSPQEVLEARREVTARRSAGRR